VSTTSPGAVNPQESGPEVVPTIADVASALFDYVAAPRMNPYLSAVGGHRVQAMELYMWNCAVGAALWEVLAYVEVAVRHAVDSALAERHARLERPDDDWLWHSDVAKEMGSKAVEDIEEAHERANTSARRRYTVTTDHVIAELNFGFWRFMFSKDREHAVGSAIRKAFPNAPRAVRANDLSDLNKIISTLYGTRNRIAHHEPIWWQHLDYRHEEALRILRYISPDLSDFVAKRSRFTELFASRPSVACKGKKPIAAESSE
jgi:hypothetical protein